MAVSRSATGADPSLAAEEAPHGVQVLVAPPREVDEHELPLGERSGKEPADRVSGLERGQDPFLARQGLEPRERLGIGRGHVLGESSLLQVGVLWAYARVVEPGRDRVGPDDLAVVVLQQVRERAVEDARLAPGERTAVLAQGVALASGLHADQPDAG